MNLANLVDAAHPVELAIGRVKKVYGAWNRGTSTAQMREDWDKLFWSDALPADEEAVSAGEVYGSLFTPPGARRDRVMLYLHGGGFRLGSVRSHRDLIIRLAAQANCSALALEYRLAPEHHFPAPLEDTCNGYACLLDRGVAPGNIIFAGDSAGGGLALSAMLKLRDEGRPLPAAAVLLSAWTDLTASRASYETCAAADPIHQRAMILATAKNYLGNGDPKDPLASPLFADLHGLPPLLMQVGDRETVLDDSRDFEVKAQAAGVSVQLSVYANMIHVFQQFAPDLPEATLAIEEIGLFMERYFA